VTLVIDSDAHWPRTLKNMRYGVATARRAWLTADHVANTRPWDELRKLRKRGGLGRRRHALRSTNYSIEERDCPG
jgi:hypothetical protein